MRLASLLAEETEEKDVLPVEKCDFTLGTGITEALTSLSVN